MCVRIRSIDESERKMYVFYSYGIARHHVSFTGLHELHNCIHNNEFNPKLQISGLQARSDSKEQHRAAVKLFNDVRQFAENARTELIIHRQAIGLTWRNQSIVEEEFPLPPPEKSD